MKLAFCLVLGLLTARLCAQLPIDLPASLSQLSMDCHEAASGHDWSVDDRTIPVEDRQYHKRLALEVTNMGHAPTTVVCVVYFFIQDAAIHEQQRYLNGSKTVQMTIAPHQSTSAPIEMPMLDLHVDNIDMMGAGQREGDKPAGWIAGFLQDGTFYPVQASDASMLEDYATSDDFKQQQAAFEKKMPKDIAERQKQEDPTIPGAAAAAQ